MSGNPYYRPKDTPCKLYDCLFDISKRTDKTAGIIYVPNLWEMAYQ